MGRIYFLRDDVEHPEAIWFASDFHQTEAPPYARIPAPAQIRPQYSLVGP